ncbi:hypothetical protein BDY19DRAFT_944159 [Irpex rosettiformis]|uniref:Uncharacterized protein n=1 Tax=Irpex rosettiformis TaxID=378272 RepID=A0ACB8U450_9APHY|nr:hypothetical protein BDY19DRAFT_944159 [Irpex rosettiformis]
MANQPLIPEGYTYLNPKTMVSKQAKKLFEEWADQVDNCNPDNFDMYIYNDFAWYGQLNIVDHALRGIHSRIERRELEEAFYRLEALTFVNALCGDWPMADDGDRVLITDKLYGACLVKTFQKLKEDDKLNAETFPNLETVLKEAVSWSESVENDKYAIVCRGIGKRLFKNKSPDVVAREKAMVKEWIDSLGKEEKEIVERRMKEDAEDEDEEDEDEDKEKEDEDEDEDDEDEDDTPWFEKGKADENLKDPSFTFSRVWKEYTAYLKEVPTVPFRGPPIWDLTEWTDEEKAPFLFSNMHDDL